jgi:hypothetical protein
LVQTGQGLILRKSTIVFSILKESAIRFQLAVSGRKGKRLPDFEKGSDHHNRTHGSSAVVLIR